MTERATESIIYNSGSQTLREEHRAASWLTKIGTQLKSLAQQPLYLNAYALIASNLFTAASSYLFWIIAARRFSAEAVGTASAALASMALLDVIANLGLEPGLIRFLGAQDEAEGNELIQASVTLRSLVTLGITIAFIAGLPLWAPGMPSFSQKPELWVAFVPLVLSNGIFTLLSAAFIGMRKAHYVLFANVIFNLTKVAGLLIGPPSSGVLAITFSVAAALLVTVIAEITIFLPRLRAEYRPTFTLHLKKLRSFFSYSFVNQIADALLGFPQMFLPILVINRLGAAANASFYTAWMTAGIVRTACISIAQSAFAEGAADTHNPGTLSTSLRRSMKLSLLFVVLGGGALAISGSWVLLLFGKSYSKEGIGLLYWLLVSVIPFSLMNLYITALRVRKQISLLLALAAVWAAASLSGVALGIQAAGLRGVAIGWTLAQFSAALLTSLVWLRQHRYHQHPSPKADVERG